MARPPKVISTSEIAKQLTEAIRITSVQPSIFGYRPLPHQLDFHSATNVGRLFIGGNRAGKTVAGAAELVMRMTGLHSYQDVKRPPVKLRAVGVDFDNGVNKIILPEVIRWLPKSYLINGSWEDSYSAKDHTLTLENDSTCEFMSYDQDVDKFAGTSRDGVWFDEEPPEAIYNECMLRLVDVHGCWWMTMTPLIDMSWTLDRLYEPGTTGANPAIKVFKVNTEQNTFVSQEVMSVLLTGMSKEEQDARKRGDYFTYSGAIYADVLHYPGSIVDPVYDTERWETIHKHWGHFGMLDHGFTNPTAFLLGAFDHDGRIIIYKEYYQAKRTVKENAEAIKDLISECKLEGKIDYIVADPSTRNTDPITKTSVQTEYAENGIYFALANNDVSAGINRVYSRLKNGQLFLARDCEKTVWEMQRYRWAKFASDKIAQKNNLKETPLKKDDHACDALRYGVVSRPELPGEVALRMGNFMGVSVAINGEKRVDDALLVGTPYVADVPIHDEYLGSDW